MIITDITDDHPTAADNIINTTQLSSLWGGIVSERKSLVVTADQLSNRKLSISHATLGELIDCNDDLKEGGRSLLSFKIGDGDEVFVCSLRLVTKEMCDLMLELDGCRDTVFSVKGSREIHLVGSYSYSSAVVNQSKFCSNDDAVEANNIPPNAGLNTYRCSSPTLNYMNCPNPTQLDIPEQREASVKLVITSESMPPNDTQMLVTSQHGSKHAQLQDQPYEGSCLSSVRRKLSYDVFIKHTRDPCKNSEVQVVGKAAASHMEDQRRFLGTISTNELTMTVERAEEVVAAEQGGASHMEDQIRSLGTISTNEPTVAVEHAEEVFAAEQGGLDITEVTSLKDDSDQAGKFVRESNSKRSQNAGGDNEGNSKRKQKRKNKHLVSVPSNTPTRDGDSVGDNEGRKKRKQKRKDEAIIAMPNDSFTHDGNDDGINVCGDNHEGNNKRKRKRVEKHPVGGQNVTQSHDGNEDGNNVDGDNDERSSDNNQQYYVLYHDSKKHTTNEAARIRKGRKEKKQKKQEKEIEEDDHNRKGKKEKKQNQQEKEIEDDDDSRKGRKERKQNKQEKEIEGSHNRNLRSTPVRLAQAKEKLDNVSGVSGVICALPAMNSQVR